VGGDLLRVFERATVLQVRGDAGGAESVAAEFGSDCGTFRTLVGTLTGQAKPRFGRTRIDVSNKRTANRKWLAVDVWRTKLSAHVRRVCAIARDNANADLIATQPAEHLPIGVHVGEVQALTGFITLVGVVAGGRIVVDAVTASTLLAARRRVVGAVAVEHGPCGPRRRMIGVPLGAMNGLIHPLPSLPCS
jgi:hypothetical protein